MSLHLLLDINFDHLAKIVSFSTVKLFFLVNGKYLVQC